MSDAIAKLRAEIDAVDDVIAASIARRRELVTRIHAEKASRGITLLDSSRETAIEERYAAAAPSLRVDQVQRLVSAILETSR